MKVVGVAVMLAIPQLSVLPPFTMAAVMLALPLASMITDTFWQLTTGASVSTTVTVKEQVAVSPAASVTW